MNRRFDSRDESTFRKDIYFSTMIEKYWWEKWLDHASNRHDVSVKNPRDNGCGNDGGFIPSGTTVGADYIADICYSGNSVKDCPIEIKWVPTPGKITLKECDIKSYIREAAYILFIYNFSNETNLRKPKDYNLEDHIRRIEDKIRHIKWGLMSSKNLENLYRIHLEAGKVKPIAYMGYKNGLVLNSEDYENWFKQEDWL